jgi:hypothetical protein
MKTTVWGPHAWRFLHAVSFEYPEHPSEEQKESARQFFNSLQTLLPCKDCCQHYAQHLQQNPVEPHLHSRDALSRWVHALHNTVNASLKKETVAYDQIFREYVNDEFSCTVQDSCHGEPLARAGPTSKERQGKHLKNHFIASIVVVLVLLVSAFLAFKLYTSRL